LEGKRTEPEVLPFLEGGGVNDQSTTCRRDSPGGGGSSGRGKRNALTLKELPSFAGGRKMLKEKIRDEPPRK